MSYPDHDLQPLSERARQHVAAMALGFVYPGRAGVTAAPPVEPL